VTVATKGSLVGRLDAFAPLPRVAPFLG